MFIYWRTEDKVNLNIYRVGQILLEYKQTRNKQVLNKTVIYFTEVILGNSPISNYCNMQIE